MKQDRKDTQAEDIAQRIATLKGKDLEDYIADAYEVLELVNKRIKEGNHSAKMLQAYRETKRTLEEILAIIQPQ